MEYLEKIENLTAKQLLGLVKYLLKLIDAYCNAVTPNKAVDAYIDNFMKED